MLLCVSASHKTAAFDLLEKLSVHTDEVGPRIAAHHECVQGAVVLSTCNRFEAYIDMDEPVTAAAAIGLEAALLAVEQSTGLAAHDLEGSYQLVTGDDVARHLFAVAAGLESVVVGEGEIAGQVRRALTDARRRGTTSPELERLFQRASQAQRGVKNGTAIGRAGRSLVRLALELADSRIADWSAMDVLMVGTGSYAAATLAALRDYGVHDVAVHSPTGRTEFATKHGLRAVPADGFASAAASAHLIITCTSVEEPVVDAALLHAGAAMTEATARTMVIDLGLPRNVDADVAGVDGVTLLDLETIRLHAPVEELRATEAAAEIVDRAAQKFSVAGETRSVTPGVVALREHVFSLLDAEIARARARGDEDGRTEHALRHLVGVLLHTPTVRARELAAQGDGGAFLDGIEALFGLEPAAEPPVAETDTDRAAG